MIRIRKIIIILTLPCVVLAQIQIEIKHGADEKNPEVVVRGRDRDKAGTVDTNLFNLTIDRVRENLKSLGWYKVQDININHASAYGYKDLYITLKPILAKIISAKDEIKQFNNVTYFLNDRGYPRKYRPVLQHDVTEKIMIKWDNRGDISVGQNIEHMLGFDEMKHASTFGQDSFASKLKTLNARSHDEITLDAGQGVFTSIEAKETTLKINVDYEISLDGDLHINYYCIKLINYCFKGKNLDVNSYFKLLNAPLLIKSNETITISYFHDPHVKFFSKLPSQSSV